MEISWNEEKNRQLKQERNICFEEIEQAILSGNILKIIPHFDTNKYQNQNIIILSVRWYTYYVPYIKEKESFFLKTIIPSRKLHKIYNK